jgi:hypothetical protein
MYGVKLVGDKWAAVRMFGFLPGIIEPGTQSSSAEAVLAVLEARFGGDYTFPMRA